MGDKRGPEYGWSQLLPVRRGWYEIAEPEQIDRPEPVVTRAWFDGTGGIFAPVEITEFQLRMLKIPRTRIVKSKRMGERSIHVVFMPINGGFGNAYFRAVGPLLHPSVPDEPKPFHLPPFQRPETYMTPSQRLEAARIEANRRKP